jgi:hypothetical protein
MNNLKKAKIKNSPDKEAIYNILQSNLIFYFHVRLKRKVYGALLLCGLPKLYGRWQLTYAL